MTKNEDTLIEAIDRTAFKLLKKIGGDANLTKDESIILAEQVKAFGEIVKWASTRADLIPKTDSKNDKFTLLKGQFHAGGSSRNRRGPSAPAAETGSTLGDFDNGDSETE